MIQTSQARSQAARRCSKLSVSLFTGDLARLDAESAAQSMLDDAASDSARSPVRDLRLEAE